MDNGKLKNIVLVILVVTNALLLGLMAFQQLESRQYRQQALQDAVELLAQQGIAAQIQDMPRQDFPVPQALDQDSEGELRSFAALLGEDTRLTQRGLVSLYTGAMGQAEVRDDGAFWATLAPGSYPLGEESMERHAAQVLSAMDIPCQLTGGDESAVTAVEMLGEVPVFSCTLTLRYDNGELRSVSGYRLPGRATPDAQGGSPLSTATLLVRFRAAVMASGDTCTAITAATQGYTLGIDSNRKTRLTPVLRLETDTNLYILDALTGELSRA